MITLASTVFFSQTGKVDPKDKKSNFIFTQYFDMTIFRVVILIHKNYELDLSEGDFAELLGNEKKILTGERILSEQCSRISQEALIGCFSTAI